MFVVALPIAIQELISCSLGLVDNLMVGSLGETELAAVGVGTQIYFLHWMLMFGFVSGSATYMAQYFGSNQIDKIRKTVGFAITVNMIVSFLLFYLCYFKSSFIAGIFTNIPEVKELGAVYVKTGAPTLFMLSFSAPFNMALRATQQTKIPLYTSFVVFGTNTFLNYVFIFGKFGFDSMGVKGAALATVISRFVEVVLVVIVIFICKNVIAGPLKDFWGWQKDFIFKIVRNSIPTTLNESLWGLGNSMYVACYARMTTTEYAAVQAANTINNVFMMTAFSVGSATLVLVGQKLGEGKLDEAYYTGKKLISVGVGVGIICGLLLIILSRPIISLFEFSDEAFNYCFIILVIHGLLMGLTLHNGMQITGTLRAGGDTKYAMIAEVSCIWGIGVVMAFVSALLLQLPIYICVLLVHLEDVVKFVLLRKRFLSKKWVRNLV